MQNTFLKKSVTKYSPKKHVLKNALIAGISGGMMGVFAQLVLVFYQNWLHLEMSEAIAPMIITVVFIAALLTGLGVYDKIAQVLGAGLFIPISGFANALAASALEGKSEGLIHGIGSTMFKLAGSVLTYGIVTAYLLGLVRYLFGWY